MLTVNDDGRLTMKATRRLGLALGMTALLSAVGCGGAAPPPSTPAQAGYAPEVSARGSKAWAGDDGARSDEAAPQPPPPPAAAPTGGGAFRSSMENYQPKKSAPAAEAPPANRPGLGTQ